MNKILYTFLILLPLLLNAQQSSNTTDSNSTLSPSIIINSPPKSEVKITNKSFDKLTKAIIQSNNNKSPFDNTLVAIILGAVISLSSQVVLEKLKSKKEKINLTLEIKSDIQRLTFLLEDHYRELAMHKAHKMYWYAQYNFERSSKKTREKEKEKFYDYHMDSGDKAFQTEINIAKTFSEYYKQINKLQFLTSFNPEVDEYLEKYHSFIPQKPTPINSTSKAELPKLESKEEYRLKEEYKTFTNYLKKINALLLK